MLIYTGFEIDANHFGTLFRFNLWVAATPSCIQACWLNPSLLPWNLRKWVLLCLGVSWVWFWCWLFRKWVVIMPCVFHDSSQCLFFTPQPVSGCLLCFMPDLNTCLWLLRMWVAAVFCLYQTCLWYLHLTLQPVSDSYVLICCKPALDACFWLFRKWVAIVPYCITTCLWSLSLAL